MCKTTTTHGIGLHTAAEAQYLDVIAKLRSCQGQQRRREKHSLIVRMGDQQQDALAPERRE